MRTDRRLIYVGVFLLTFGGVLLAARQGWIPEQVMSSLWQLWPVLLIAIGLSIILASRPGAWLVGVVASVCLGAMAASVIQTGIVPFIGCVGETGTQFEAQSGQLASQAGVDVTFSCGELEVTTGQGADWSVEGTSEGGRGPTVRVSDDGIEIEPAARSPFGFGGARERWTVTLPTEPTIGFGLTLNAGAGRIELGGAHLTDIDLTVNAGSLSLDLRGVEAIEGLDGTINAGSSVTWLPSLALEGGFTVNAGSFVICAPEDLALRIETGDNPISSNDFDRAGLVETDDGWETPGYSTATVQTDLRVTANAGSISFNPTEPCDG